MNCDKHPRNPSWWGDSRSCYECAKDAYGTYTPPVRPAWLTAHLQGAPDTGAMYVERTHGVTREGKAAGSVSWNYPTKGINR